MKTLVIGGSDATPGAKSRVRINLPPRPGDNIRVTARVTIPIYGDLFAETPIIHLQGHRQVTDAWLAALARRRRGRLATLDSALATLHADVADLLPA